MKLISKLPFPSIHAAAQVHVPEAPGEFELPDDLAELFVDAGCAEYADPSEKPKSKPKEQVETPPAGK